MTTVAKAALFIAAPIIAGTLAGALVALCLVQGSRKGA